MFLRKSQRSDPEAILSQISRLLLTGQLIPTPPRGMNQAHVGVMHQLRSKIRPNSRQGLGST